MAQSGHTERYEELIYYYPLHLRLLILKVVDGLSSDARLSTSFISNSWGGLLLL